MKEQEPTHVQPTISMPSSDLITYRFDQTDKKLDSLDKKFDAQSAIFATKEELGSINKRLDNYTWYWRTVFTSVLLLLGGVIAALIERK